MRRLFAPLALASGLVWAGSAAGGALDLDNMSVEDQAKLRTEIRAYLLENPEVIMEAINILEQRRQQQAQAADRELVAQLETQLLDDGFSYVGGNPDGDVTVVEFLDYRCGFCKRAHPEVEEMLDRDPNIRLIVKEFPILGPDSVQAGRMALAALDLDRSKYAVLNDALMTYNGNLTEQVAYRIAIDIGYDAEELREKANSDIIGDRLQQNYQLAQALGVQGTPAFVVGSEVIRGYLPVNDMLAAVNDARLQQR